MSAPFPWFGGKSRVASIVWERFGNVVNYVEPFFGSGAVLFGRHGDKYGTETINDLDGFVSNFWRSVKFAPEETARWADCPVNENDLHARHFWLVERREELVSHLEGNPDYYDPKIAGYWVWGICLWIGSGWCSGEGPWSRDEAGMLSKDDRGRGINRQMPHLGNRGRGINRQMPHLGNRGQGIQYWFVALSNRLREVRVCSGDWLRVCGPSVTFKHGMTGVFLDPPYADTAGRTSNLYSIDSLSVAHAVREWTVEAGKNPLLRIALCGYEGEHEMPDNWHKVEWKAKGGYANESLRGSINSNRERIWFSPACLDGRQGMLF